MAVGRMQAYITGHLREPITQRQLAEAAGYSQFHCARMFKELVGVSPFEYIRKLRLTESALKLRDHNAKVLDVALEYVFDSHEGFTRAFAREFGITPKRYAMEPPPVRLFMPNNIHAYYVLVETRRREEAMKENQNAPSAIFVQIMERPARKAIIKRGKTAEEYYAYCEEIGCDVWGVFCSVKEALYEPVGMWMPDSFRPAGTSLYVQGVEVPADYSGKIPEGMELIDLPACKVMIFQGPVYDENDMVHAIGETMDLIEGYNPTIYGYEWAPELAPRFQLAPAGYRGYIEGRPVREVARG